MKNISKILLISPPAFTFKKNRDINPLPPMGLGYLAAVAEKAGIEVEILDCLVEGWNQEEYAGKDLVRVGLKNHEIEERIARFKPDIIGINCQFSRQYRIYHELLGLIKKILPDCLTVCGGAHVTVCPEEVLKDLNCDFIISGEGEESFLDLLLALRSGRDLSGVDGLGWRCGTDIYVNEKRKWIVNLDSLPFPAYHLMKLENYFGLAASHGVRHKKRFVPVVTSRGCPAKCTFCSAHKVWGRNYRFRSVGNVIEEMLLLKNKYQIEEIMFEDDNVTAHPGRAKELFKAMIAAKLDFVWDTPNGAGVWSMDEEMIDHMKAAGCVTLNFPVESGSQRVLSEAIKKPLNLEKVKKLIRHCKEIGLPHSMFLVIGMPGEKISDMWQSIKFAAECGCYTPHISVATPYPGTELLVDCVGKGYLARPFSLDDLFISSYAIKTEDWGKPALKAVFVFGKLYLRILQYWNQPKLLLELSGRIFKKVFASK